MRFFALVSAMASVLLYFVKASVEAMIILFLCYPALRYWLFLFFRYGFVKNLIAYSLKRCGKENCFHDQRFGEMTRRLYGAAGEISMN